MRSSLPTLVIRLEFGLNDRSENRGIVGDRSIDQCGSSRFLVFASFDGLETLEGIPELLQGILSCLRLRRKKPADSSIEKTVEIVVVRAEPRPFHEIGHGYRNRSLDGTTLARFIRKTVSGEDAIDAFDKFFSPASLFSFRWW